MASKSSFLRNIRLSGGLFTENILLRLRDNPTQLKIGKTETFNVSSKKELDTKQLEIFEWSKQKWDEISPKIDSWTLEELIEKWLIPFFEQFDHELQDFEMNEDNVDEDSPIKGFQINYQSKDHKNPFFHLVDISVEFDSKISPNPQGKSHHNICQHFINTNPKIEWLILSNGRILRLLTKYYHTYSKGYLEFDIENILSNRDLIEFNTLYSTIHSSRFIKDSEDEEFLINQFQKESVIEGVKIGDALRDKVHDAIELLGDDLILQNPKFLEKIISKVIDPQEYYAELLRIIYRIIFILYAEQREMLPGAGSIYFEQFSLSSLRFLAEKPIKAEKNTDLWNKLFITFNLVNEGNDFLEVNAFSGSLFKDKSANENEGLRIILENNLKVINETVLKIIRLLTTSKFYNVLQRINFLEISELEIGAVYESLLDYQPVFNANGIFQLIEGSERKSTGSYYTPSSLIDILINTTLQPLVDKCLKRAGDDKKERENAILNLKICDPACGGGTFLLTALDFLGKKLAEERTNLESPLEKDLRDARRDILQHCIYGVDVNPLAVELAKISLWLKASVNDKPLTFLDNHIKNGNSLIGINRSSNIDEIPYEAFEIISSKLTEEKKKIVERAKRKLANFSAAKNQGKKTYQTTLIEYDSPKKLSKPAKLVFKMKENSTNQLKEKTICYNKLMSSNTYINLKYQADLWVSAFFWDIDNIENIPTNILIYKAKIGKIKPDHIVIRKMNQISKEHKIFNWYLEFPEIFTRENSGFDCILSNPPYINLIENLELRKWFKYIFSEIYHGKLDLCYYFVYNSLELLNDGGALGFVIKRYFLKSPVAKNFRDYVKENYYVNFIIDYGNQQIFPDAGIQVLTLSIFNEIPDIDRKTTYLLINDEVDIKKIVFEKIINEGISRFLKSINDRWIFEEDEVQIKFKKSVPEYNISEVIKLNNISVESGKLDFKAFKLVKGVQTGKDSVFIVDISKDLEDDKTRLFIKGKHLEPYNIKNTAKKIIVSHSGSKIVGIKESGLSKWPKIENYLKSNEKILRNRSRAEDDKWPLWRKGDERKTVDFTIPKLVWPYRGPKFYAAIDRKGHYHSQDVILLTIDIKKIRSKIINSSFSEELLDWWSNESIYFYLGIFNSKIFENYLFKFAKEFANNVRDFQPNNFKNLLLPLYSNKNKIHVKIVNLIKQIEEKIKGNSIDNQYELFLQELEKLINTLFINKNA